VSGEAGDNRRATFSEGDLVVYPNHGAGRVAGIEEKTILGEVRRYYVVYLPDTELMLSVPADGDSGLRACAGEESVAKAIALLGENVTEMPSNWNHRLKHNREKIKSGEIEQVAEVVRNLLLKARQILASEVALSRGIETADAEKLVDDALRKGGSV
jgi:CarD family transcriptional regulator